MVKIAAYIFIRKLIMQHCNIGTFQYWQFSRKLSQIDYLFSFENKTLEFVWNLKYHLA